MVRVPTFEERKQHYAGQWSTMKVKPERVASVDAAARRLLSNKTRYQTIEKASGVPWFVVAAIHQREASGSFAGVLHNGEKIIGTGRKTKLVPAGRGPFSTWEGAAIDALTMHPISKNKSWSIERICYHVEQYNGWGYWWRGDKSSAYLWAGTNIDGGGKFVADGVWSSTTQDSQNGAMATIKRLSELDPSIRLFNEGYSPVAVAPTSAPSAPTSSSKPLTASVDPQRQVGGVLNAAFKLIQSILKRKG